MAPKKRFLRTEWKEDDKVAVYVVTGSFSPAWRAEGEKAQKWLKIQEANSEDSGVNREDMEGWRQALENLKGEGKQCRPHTTNMGKDAEKGAIWSSEGLKKWLKKMILPAFYTKWDQNTLSNLD